MSNYFSDKELTGFGFSKLGQNVRISKSTCIHNCENIEIGDNVRIDNFCTIVLSDKAKLTIGNYVHISAYSFINGAADLDIGDFVTTAPFVRIFTSSDDYSGNFLTGGVVPRHLIGTISSKVIIEQHVIIGTGSTIMPGTILRNGTAVGAHSFVRRSTNPLEIVAGIPAKRIGKRSDHIWDLEKWIYE